MNTLYFKNKLAQIFLKFKIIVTLLSISFNQNDMLILDFIPQHLFCANFFHPDSKFIYPLILLQCRHSLDVFEFLHDIGLYLFYYRKKIGQRINFFFKGKKNLYNMIGGMRLGMYPYIDRIHPGNESTIDSIGKVIKHF